MIRRTLRFGTFTLVSALSFAGCGGSGATGGEGGSAGGTGGVAGSGGTAGSGGGATGLPLLGDGKHDASAVQVTEIGSASDGLVAPRDLAFNPQEPTELWVVNRGGPSVTIFFSPGSSAQESTTRSGSGGEHFLAQVSALAFGAPGMLATAQEQDQVTQPTTPAEFMGPTLWTSDIGAFNAGFTSHLDMLHNSPDSVGIAWDHDNVYWIFDGFHRALTRYDFATPHQPGGSDHSDGVVERYVEGEVGYQQGVASHMELDHATGLLYVADTANARVAVLDTSTGQPGASIGPNYDGDEQRRVDGAKLWTLVDGPAVGLERPSGLALRDGMVFVGDNATGKIFAFDLQGELLDWLQTDVSPDGLMGIELDASGSLYVVDAAAARLIRIQALPQGE